MSALRKNPLNNDKRKFTGDPEDFRLSLVEHLEELRTRVIRCVLVLTAGAIFGWIQFKPIFDYLNQMVKTSIESVVPSNLYQEKFDNLTGPFLLQLHLAFLIGLTLAFPFIVLQLWGFIAPALKPEEQKPIKRLAPLSVLLFMMGVGFCWAVMPAALKFFAEYLKNFNGFALFQTAGTMVFFILKMLFAFGMAFQLPLFVYILGMLDLLKAETLVKYWRHSATIIFIISMVVTPSQDPLTMMMMAIPLTILFVISVYAVKFTQRRKARLADVVASDDGKTFLLPSAQMAPDEPVTPEEEAAEEENHH
ncbi:MAG: twin-arginine translocase subunit TatC [Fimbriimonas sp.]